MEQLKIFENEEFGQVRTVMRDGEVWFVGKDVAEALGYGKGKSLANALGGLFVVDALTNAEIDAICV